MQIKAYYLRYDLTICPFVMKMHSRFKLSVKYPNLNYCNKLDLHKEDNQNVRDEKKIDTHHIRNLFFILVVNCSLERAESIDVPISSGLAFIWWSNMY